MTVYWAVAAGHKRKQIGDEIGDSQAEAIESSAWCCAAQQCVAFANKRAAVSNGEAAHDASVGCEVPKDCSALAVQCVVLAVCAMRRSEQNSVCYCHRAYRS